MLDIVLYYRQPLSLRGQLEMFYRGLKRHGLKPEIRSTLQPRRSDLAVFWAHKQTAIMEMQRSAGRDYLVLERGYFRDRFAMTSLGYNGLNGHAEFHNRNSPPDRWQKYGVPVKEWKQGGEIIVLMGQVPTDASLRNCSNYRRWVEESARNAQKIYGKPVYFRPHPHPSASNFKPTIPVIGGSLDQALDRAAAVIIWNSNSGVDAVLNGVPLIAGDRGTMAYSMAAKFGEPIVRPDRTQWLHDLAYTQWTESELINGEAWAHIGRRFESAAMAS